MALLVSPVGAASLGVMEARDANDLVENTSYASDASLLENDSLGPEAESSSEGIVAEGIITEDVVASFLAMPSAVESEVFLGMYTSASLQVTANEIGQVDAWLNANGINTRVARPSWTSNSPTLIGTFPTIWMQPGTRAQYPS
jgi:hypothetical protein